MWLFRAPTAYEIDELSERPEHAVIVVPIHNSSPAALTQTALGLSLSKWYKVIERLSDSGTSVTEEGIPL